MTNKICVLGSYVCQMSVYLPHVPVLGETIVAREFDMGQGGKGHNVAVAISRLGGKVLLIEKVGQDIFGDMALESYNQENIDTDHISRTDRSSSGIGLVYIQPTGENTAAYYPGANQHLAKEDIINAKDDLQAAEMLYLQLEIPDDPIMEAVSIADLNGLKVILNPAPAREIPRGLLEKVNVLTPNQVEAFALISEDYQADLSLDEIENLGKKLLELGPEEVYLTLGSRGALYVNQGGSSIYQPCLEVEVIDTVGAGDAFNAALCVALSKGFTPEQALFRACVNGALTTTKIGVINALPSADEVEDFITAYKAEKGSAL
jgi:ribokinase